jgi:acetate kinase
MTKTTRILSLNAGSSSLKFAAWSIGDSPNDERELWTGAAEGLGGAQAQLWLKSPDKSLSVEKNTQLADVKSAVLAAFALCKEHGLEAPEAIGHRIVHGGPDHASPQRIDEALLKELRKLVAWAPLHLPPALDAVAATTAHYPGVPQVACFDTAFHRALPELAQRFPFPRALWERGVRRYGFHGLSYEYIVSHLGADADGRTIVAHLGSGSSLAAMRDRKPVDTSMGFRPTGGVMMGTRTGDIDPGVLLYLLTEGGYDTQSLGELVDRQSGLLGVSGLTADVRQLLAAAKDHPHAAQALEAFCYSVKKQIGAYAAVLGGLDTLVFTGGIGERAAWVRAEICQTLSYLGIELDGAANASSEPVISSQKSRCKVRVVATDEARMIARHTREVSAR